MKFLRTTALGIFCLSSIAYASVELNTARIAYYNLRDCERARTACLQGIEKGQENWELYAILSGCELDAGKWHRAADALIKALEIDSASTFDWITNKGGGDQYFFQAFYFSARELFDDVNYEKALMYLDYAELFDPLNTDVYILRGAILHKVGRFEEANKQYQRVHDLDPENPDINFLIARTLFEAAAYENSIQYLFEAVQNYMKEYDRILLLIFQHVPEVDNALIHELVRVWARQDYDSLDLLLREKLQFDRGVDVHEATIKEFYRISMDLARTHYFIGMAQRELGNDSLALVHLKKSLNFNPDDINALYYTGEISVQCAMFDQAAPYLAQATAMQPDDVHAWFYLGVCYAQCGDYKKAIDVFENQVLRLDPENIEALTNLVYVYGEIGDHDKAIEYTLQLNELKNKKN
jgi:tetratricopeptide (TPR) repeat protein